MKVLEFDPSDIKQDSQQTDQFKTALSAVIRNCFNRISLDFVKVSTDSPDDFFDQDLNSFTSVLLAYMQAISYSNNRTDILFGVDVMIQKKQSFNPKLTLKQQVVEQSHKVRVTFFVDKRIYGNIVGSGYKNAGRLIQLFHPIMVKLPLDIEICFQNFAQEDSPK